MSLDQLKDDDLFQSLRARTHRLTFSQTEEQKAEARLRIDEAIAEIANRGGRVEIKDYTMPDGFETKKFRVYLNGGLASWVL